MTKLEFLLSLNEKLSGFPKKDVQERLSFYSEMIEDRMEEGISEEEAVGAVGDIDDIAAQIAAELSCEASIPAPSAPKRRLNVWEILLIILGFPLWFSLLAAAFAAALSLYITVWSLIISLWAVFAALILCAVLGTAAGIVFIVTEQALSGIALMGAGMICAGLGIFLFFGCSAATKGICICTKTFALRLKKRFTKKEDAQ